MRTRTSQPVVLLALAICSGASPPAIAGNVAPNVPQDATYDDKPVLSGALNAAMAAFLPQISVAQRRSMSGFSARADCEITANGHVKDCKSVDPNDEPLFTAALIQALQRPDLQGSPMLLDGKPVTGRHVFAINVTSRRTRR